MYECLHICYLAATSSGKLTVYLSKWIPFGQIDSSKFQCIIIILINFVTATISFVLNVAGDLPDLQASPQPCSIKNKTDNDNIELDNNDDNNNNSNNNNDSNNNNSNNNNNNRKILGWCLAAGDSLDWIRDRRAGKEGNWEW